MSPEMRIRSHPSYTLRHRDEVTYVCSIFERPSYFASLFIEFPKLGGMLDIVKEYTCGIILRFSESL